MCGGGLFSSHLTSLKFTAFNLEVTTLLKGGLYSMRCIGALSSKAGFLCLKLVNSFSIWFLLHLSGLLWAGAGKAVARGIRKEHSDIQTWRLYDRPGQEG